MQRRPWLNRRPALGPRGPPPAWTLVPPHPLFSSPAQRSIYHPLIPARLPPPRPPYPPLPPPSPAANTNDQVWLNAFQQTHWSAQKEQQLLSHINGSNEPPLMVLRRRITRTQELIKHLKAAAEALAGVEQKLETHDSIDVHDNAEPRHWEEALGLWHAQRDKHVAECILLTEQLSALNVPSGLFPTQDFAAICTFAQRVAKKKAYRKRAKLRRRAAVRDRRAQNLVGEDTGVLLPIAQNTELPRKKTVSLPPALSTQEKAREVLSPITERGTVKQSLDPETLTMTTLIAVRRAWDAYVVYPHTPGASTIPPHFVSPPSAPSSQWAAYAMPSVRLGNG